MYRNGIKRLLAVVLSLCGMVCLFWLFLILAIAIKIDSPGPVFFKQKRVGIGKKHFSILKFRTMRIDSPTICPPTCSTTRTSISPAWAFPAQDQPGRTASAVEHLCGRYGGHRAPARALEPVRPAG